MICPIPSSYSILLRQHYGKHQFEGIDPFVVLDLPEDRLPIMLDGSKIMLSVWIVPRLEFVEVPDLLHDLKSRTPIGLPVLKGYNSCTLSSLIYVHLTMRQPLVCYSNTISHRLSNFLANEDQSASDRRVILVVSSSAYYDNS